MHSLTYLQNRLDLIHKRLEDSRFLNNDGLGNEIGFWVFEHPAEYELQVRQYIMILMEKLQKRNHRFVCASIFQILVDMLMSRGLLERTFERERQVGSDALQKALAGPLSQDKVARYLADQLKPETQEFVILWGLGSAWPLVRGHELLSALQDVMGKTPLLLFYPGTYSGQDLHPFGLVEARNYYRAFKLVPEDGKTVVAI